MSSIEKSADNRFVVAVGRRGERECAQMVKMVMMVVMMIIGDGDDDGVYGGDSCLAMQIIHVALACCHGSLPVSARKCRSRVPGIS